MIESNSTIFKKGIFFGFGFFLPILLSLAVYIGFLSLDSMSHNYNAHDGASSEAIKKKTGNKGIEIVSFRDIKNGNFTFIVGSYKNISSSSVSSFSIEAEFFDKDGKFVWQERESIYKNIEPNEIHNFAIKCGCHEHAIPDYSKVVVTVSN